MRQYMVSLIGLLAACLPVAGHAGVILTSVPSLTATPVGSGICSSSSCGYQVFNSFTLTGDWTVSEIDFAVTSIRFTGPPITVFIDTISAGLPDTVLYSQEFSGYSYNSTGHLTDIVTVYPTDLTLNRGSYDISFYSAGSLGLADYTDSGASFYQAGFGTRSNVQIGFDLIGTPAAVAEPPAAAMLGFSLIGLGIAFHKRPARRVGRSA